MMLPLMPEKHSRLNETVLGIGALILGELSKPDTSDAVWEKVRRLKSTKTIPDKISFDDVIVALTFLYAIQAIVLGDQGVLHRAVDFSHGE